MITRSRSTSPCSDSLPDSPVRGHVSAVALSVAGVLILLVFLVLALACSSPNRGRWSGTFDGSVSGTVEFDINARGTKVKGRMNGETVNGEPFRATLEGVLRQDFFRADFEGRAGGSLGLPVPFTGEMTGSLDLGVGRGEWNCTLWRGSGTLQGTWSVEQIEP